jgi:hypothetical protein
MITKPNMIILQSYKSKDRFWYLDKQIVLTKLAIQINDFYVPIHPKESFYLMTPLYLSGFRAKR